MIADDKVLFPLEASKDAPDFVFRCAVEEVAKEIDGVIAADLAVPVGDKRFVHLLHRRKRAVAETDDVCVAEMGVRSEVNHGSMKGLA